MTVSVTGPPLDPWDGSTVPQDYLIYLAEDAQGSNRWLGKVHLKAGGHTLCYTENHDFE